MRCPQCNSYTFVMEEPNTGEFAVVCGNYHCDWVQEQDWRDDFEEFGWEPEESFQAPTTITKWRYAT